MKPSLFVSLAALALAACNQTPSPDTKQDGGEELAVADGKLVLPAVSGNPGAAYFSIVNRTKEPASLAAAAVAGAAKAELHESSGNSMSPLAAVAVPAGATVAFERGGKHVMVFGVPQSLKPGNSVRLTLTFAGGKTITGPLQVEAAGGGEMH